MIGKGMRERGLGIGRLCLWHTGIPAHKTESHMRMGLFVKYTPGTSGNLNRDQYNKQPALCWKVQNSRFRVRVPSIKSGLQLTSNSSHQLTHLTA